MAPFVLLIVFHFYPVIIKLCIYNLFKIWKKKIAEGLIIKVLIVPKK